MKKVLIIAYACEPNKTSEPGVGWRFSQEIASFMDVTVLTRANNRQSIEAAENDLNIKYIYLDLPKIFTRIKKKVPFGIQIYSRFWQTKAYKEVNRLMKNSEVNFDIVHHLTFGTTKNVPKAYKFNKPFIWGPIGGGDLIPYRFLKKMGVMSHLSEFFYMLLHTVSNVSPLSYLTRNKSSAIIFRTDSTFKRFPKNGCKNRYLISESALDEAKRASIKKEITNELNVLCVGRIIHGKGYIYALRGFHDFLKSGGNGKLVFLGEGPEEHSLKSYVKKYRLESYVQFKGHIPKEEVEKELINGHLLIHPSFREGGSWAIMEAMSFGLPVICLNTSGPKDMVTNKCGLLIDMVSPNQVSTDIGAGLISFINNKEMYNRMSENAILRIRTEYNWDKRRIQIKRVYEEVLGLNK